MKTKGIVFRSAGSDGFEECFRSPGGQADVGTAIP